LPSLRVIGPLSSVAFGVGHTDDEDPLSAMRSADFLRSPECRRSSVAHALQLADDIRCSGSKMTGDVLDADEPGLKDADDVGDVGPEVSLVLVGSLLPGDRERLTRDAAKDAVHEASPRASVEGSEVTPDRRCVQPPFFHAADQYAGRIGFPLDVTDRASSEACSSESVAEAEVEASDA
jgi:hypothetical protein